MDNNNNFKLKDLAIIKPFISEKKFLVFLILISSVIYAVIEAYIPRLNGFLIDELNYAGDKTTFYIVFYIIAIIILVISIYVFIVSVGYFEVHFSRTLRHAVFDKLQHMKISFYNNNNDGWIIARVGSDVSRLSEVISWRLADAFSFVLLFIFYMVLIYSINIYAGIVLTIVFPALVLSLLKIKNLMIKVQRQIRKQNSKITSSFNELIGGIATIKTLNLEKNVTDDFDLDNDLFMKFSKKGVLYSRTYAVIVIVVGYLGIALLLNVNAQFYFGSKMTTGEFFTIMTYATIMIGLAADLSAVFSDIQRAQANLERLITILDSKEVNTYTEEQLHKYGSIYEVKEQEKIIGDIEFKNVDFGYNHSDLILKNFNLEVKAGQSIALVGNTGGGKTTIVNLISRFYDPLSGEILIDGRAASERTHNWLTSQLGYVLQFPILFKGTIRDNILYGSNNVSEEQYSNICDRLGLKYIFDKLEKGDQTYVGASGGRLSVGEKQLVSFARALVRDPKIIVLDEATSSIDTYAEELIQKAIQEIMKGRTSFVIAHRLSTIKECDIILYIQDGKIIERGTHTELFNMRGKYYELYKTQYAFDFKKVAIDN